MSFSIDISEFVRKTKINERTVCRKIAMDVFTGIVSMTPVDTGIAKNNWYPTTNSPSTESSESANVSGLESINRINARTATWDVERPMFLVNNLPYIQRLEHGWSQQAPAGMVRVTLSRFDGIVKAAAQ